MKKTKLDEAILFAAEAHAGAVRKSKTTPYIVHPVEDLAIVCTLTEDEKVRMAAVLHDTVEDTKTTLSDIEEKFGKRVAELVAAQSENKREGQPETDTWRIRKEEALEHLSHTDRDVKILYLGDKLSNVRDLCRDYRAVGEKLWERFNAPDGGKGLAGKAANIGWYYRGVADRLKDELSETPAWKELDEKIGELFEKRRKEETI